MSDQHKDQLELLQLIIAANSAEKLIKTALEARQQLRSNSYNMTSRVKTADRAISKLQRLRLRHPETRPIDVYDILGFRITSLFQSSVIDVVSELLDIVQNGNYADIPLVKNSIKSVTLLTSRPHNDPLSLRNILKPFFEERKINFDDPVTEDLYSSVHLVFMCKIDNSLKVEAYNGEMPVEFQIRTVMEESWGQMSKTLSHGKTGTSAEKAKSHLSVLKQVVDAAIYYADLIKAEVDQYRSGMELEREKPKSVVPIDSATADLPEAPDDIRADFIAALKLQKAAQLSDETESPQLFVNAALAFAEIEKKVASRDKDISASNMNEIIYRLQMERAFCLLYTKIADQLEEAFDIYTAIKRNNPEDALCTYRLAFTLRRKNELDRAQEAFIETTKILIEERDERLKGDYSLHILAFRQLGITSWLQFKNANSHQLKEKKLTDAIDYALNAYDYAKKSNNNEELIRDANNILYYSWERINLGLNSVISKEKLIELLKIISSDNALNQFELRERDAIIDTICRIKRYLGDDKDVLIFSLKLKDLLLNKAKRRSGGKFDFTNMDSIQINSLVKELLTEDEADSYSFVQIVLAEAQEKALRQSLLPPS